jgi:uncharacterized membrane protein YkvI
VGKQSISIKKVAILAGAFCAYMIGSGFSTGQEILQFFSTSGPVKGIIAALVYMVLMMFFTYILYGLGQRKQFNNPYDVFEYYCGKYIGKVYTWYSVILLYGTYIVMLSGAGATIHQYYGTSIYIGTYGVALIALTTALLGVEKLIDIIGVIGPIEILFMIIIGVAALAALAEQPNLLSVNGALIATSGFKTVSGNWLWSGILYALLGLMFGVAFFVINGQSAKSVKEARISGMIGTGVYTLAIILLIITETVYLDIIKGQQVPTLAIAKHVAPVLGLIFSVIILLCIYSAVASILLVVTRNFANDKTKKFYIIAIVLTVIGMFTSTVLPFDRLVNILYPISGYSGIGFLGFVAYKEFINRDAFPMAKKATVENSEVNSGL